MLLCRSSAAFMNLGLPWQSLRGPACDRDETRFCAEIPWSTEEMPAVAAEFPS